MSGEKQPSTEESHPEDLSFREKLTYGLGDVAHSAGPGTIVPFWYLFFLTDVARLRPGLAGLTVLIGGIWDAINDPLVGLWSDRTRTRWGRRRPFMLFGALPYGVTFALMWWVPPIEDQLLKALYFALVYILFDTAVTIVSCPYYALTPELTLDHDERTSLTSYRMFISIVSGLITAIGFSLVLDAAPDERTAFWVMGVLCSGLFVATILIAVLGTRERTGFQVEPPARPLESLRFVLRNYDWRYTLGMRILSWIPVDVASAVFAYFLIYWIGMRAMEASLVQAVLLGSAALTMPLILWMTRRWEKKTAFIIATGSWAVVMLGLLLVPQGAKHLVYPIAILVGPGVAAAHTLPTAMSADTLDVDELNSGRRQEGVYAGFEIFVRKLSTKLVLAGIGPVLAWAGYVERSASQTPQTLTAIRLLIAVVPAVILFAAIGVAWRYPLTRSRHRAIQKELAERRAVTADPPFGGS
ncbi:MAG: glycoside-pentoside-hexuronide (GPH):cation symporter [Chloroflexota bacterium]|nr:glycoside-pentoside-hexuronide (GPH):cation symporter [Chloroflexota bacterium]